MTVETGERGTTAFVHPVDDLTLEMLEGRLQARTGGRLAQLRVWDAGDLFCVSATAPSYYVRQLAEQTLMSLLPDRHLCFEIEVCRPMRGEGQGEPIFGNLPA